MDNDTVLKLAMDNYDKNKKIFEKAMKNIHYVSFDEMDETKTEYKILFIDKNYKTRYSINYEILGFFYNVESLFQWSWSMSNILKKYRKKSTNLLLYGVQLENDNNSILKNELINSRFKIQSKTQLDIHIAHASYISKIPHIYGLPIYDSLINEEKDNKGNIIYNVKKKYSEEKFKILYFFLLDPLVLAKPGSGPGFGSGSGSDSD